MNLYLKDLIPTLFIIHDISIINGVKPAYRISNTDSNSSDTRN